MRTLLVAIALIASVFSDDFQCYVDEDANQNRVVASVFLNSSSYSWTVSGSSLAAGPLSWGIYTSITKSPNTLTGFGSSYVTAFTPLAQSATEVTGQGTGTFAGAGANNLAGRSVIIYNALDDSPQAACNIGYYSASSNLRCYFDGSIIVGYIEFTTGSVSFNLVAQTNAFGGPGAPNPYPKIHTYYYYKSYTNTGLVYNPTADYGNIFKFRNVTLATQNSTDTSTWSTTTYNTAIANSATIAGRSIVFSNSSTPIAYCIVGYSSGTVTDAPSTPVAPTTQPPVTDSANSLTSITMLLMFVIAYLLL